MREKLNISPHFFYPKMFLKTLEEELHQFPTNLSEDSNSNNSLQNYWIQSVLSPVGFVIGQGENADMIVRDENYNLDGNLTELTEFDIIHSLWFGKCTSFVPKKPRKAKEELFLIVVYQG